MGEFGHELQAWLDRGADNGDVFSPKIVATVGHTPDYSLKVIAAFDPMLERLQFG